MIHFFTLFIIFIRGFSKFEPAWLDQVDKYSLTYFKKVHNQMKLEK